MTEQVNTQVTEQVGETVSIAGLRVAICLPCYKGVVPIDWAVAFARTQTILAMHGCQSWLQCRSNSGLIHAVRNELVHCALEDATTTHILFIDDDVIWDPNDVLKLLAYTQKPDVKFVCGMYPTRTDEPNFMMSLDRDRDGILIQNPNGLLRATGVPAGFMLVKREVFEDRLVIAQCPGTVPSRGDMAGKLLVGYFDYMHEGLTSIGEDIAFCRRVVRSGISIWIDPLIELAHVGTKAYRASFKDWLIEQHKVRPQGGA